MAKKIKTLEKKPNSTITIDVTMDALNMECKLGIVGTGITPSQYEKAMLTSIQAVRQQFSYYCFKHKITDKRQFHKLYESLKIKELLDLDKNP